MLSNIIGISLSALLIAVVVGMLLYLRKHKAYMMMAVVAPLVVFALMVAWVVGMIYVLELLGV